MKRFESCTRKIILLWECSSYRRPGETYDEAIKIGTLFRKYLIEAWAPMQFPEGAFYLPISEKVKCDKLEMWVRERMRSNLARGGKSIWSCRITSAEN